MASLNWGAIVGDKTLENGGYIGDMLKVARAHISDAVDNGEMTQAQAGEVYTALLPSVLQQGIAFNVQDVQLKLSKIPSTLK